MGILLPLLLVACSPAPASTPARAAQPTPAVEATRAPGPTHVPAALTETPEPQPRSLTLAAVGDLMLDRDVEALMLEHGPLYPFERVLGLLTADLLVGNLEGTLTHRGEAMAKTYTFRTDPALADSLRLAGFDAVSLANNHATDFGEVGLRDTIDALAAAGVPHFGAGPDAASAREPVLLEANALTVALLGYSDIGETRFAGESTPGVSYADLEVIERDVRAASERADFVVVTLHAGTEYERVPTSRQRELARSAIDAGADAVVGHHPHVPQAWERYAGGVILYSLGNFVFDLDAEDLQVLGRGPFEAIVAVLTLTEGAPPEVTFRPALIDRYEVRPAPATPADAASVLEGVPELRGE